ncbi:MAG: AMIN domain-containing protein [Deltaproteobacteria bacterium]|nr:AMIN domain-containing protein [Deltaproteobacteria bacterium]
MRSLPDGDWKRAAVVLCVLLTAEACSQQLGKLGAVTPALAVSEPQAALQPPPTYTGPLRLYEVRVIETAGQHSVLFRFSRPPEGIDYFPLRGPSRLVIDIKGAVESLPKVQNYKAADPLVTAVRVGSYQGRMRLVVDLKGGEVPQFSVDNYDTLLTAFIGEKSNDKEHAESNAQVLFISDEARNGHLAHPTLAVDKPLTAPVEEKAPSIAASPTETALPDASKPATTQVAEVPQEEVIPPAPPTFSANAAGQEPVETAQAAPPAAAPAPAPKGQRGRKGPAEEALSLRPPEKKVLSPQRSSGPHRNCNTPGERSRWTLRMQTSMTFCVSSPMSAASMSSLLTTSGPGSPCVWSRCRGIKLLM